jgi:hypothetical protein
MPANVLIQSLSGFGSCDDPQSEAEFDSCAKATAASSAVATATALQSGGVSAEKIEAATGVNSLVTRTEDGGFKFPLTFGKTDTTDYFASFRSGSKGIVSGGTGIALGVAALGLIAIAVYSMRKA